MKRRAAFTLVELIVVVGILAVLVALLLPALVAARRQAATTACLANLAEIGDAVGVYAAGNRGRLPYGLVNGFFWFPNPGTSVDWPTLLKLPKVFRCPAQQHEFVTFDYKAHPRLFPDLTTPASLVGGKPLRGYTLGSVRRSHEVALCFDGNDAISPIAYGLDNFAVYRRDRGYLTSDGPPPDAAVEPMDVTNSPIFFASSLSTVWPMADVDWPHGRGGRDAANVVFADGHAETRRRGEITRRNCYLDAR